MGEFELINADHISERDLAVAAALTRYSNHPIAKSMSLYDKGLHVENAKEEAGMGVSGTVDGHQYSFGRSKTQHKEPFTISVLKTDGENPIEFRFSDLIRSDAKDTVSALEACGLTREILSGDRREVVALIAKQLSIPNYSGEFSPEDKQTHLSSMAKRRVRALMVGDGINDAPALAAAHVSASLAAASDISQAAADIILQSDRLDRLPVAIKIAKLARKRIRENLIFAALYNFCAVPIAVLGFVNPLIAALAMSGSSIIVTVNALRMKTS